MEETKLGSIALPTIHILLKRSTSQARPFSVTTNTKTETYVIVLQQFVYATNELIVILSYSIFLRYPQNLTLPMDTKVNHTFPYLAISM